MSDEFLRKAGATLNLLSGVANLGDKWELAQDNKAVLNAQADMVAGSVDYGAISQRRSAYQTEVVKTKMNEAYKVTLASIESGEFNKTDPQTFKDTWMKEANKEVLKYSVSDETTGYINKFLLDKSPVVQAMQLGKHLGYVQQEVNKSTQLATVRNIEELTADNTKTWQELRKASVHEGTDPGVFTKTVTDMMLEQMKQGDRTLYNQIKDTIPRTAENVTALNSGVRFDEKYQSTQERLNKYMWLKALDEAAAPGGQGVTNEMVKEGITLKHLSPEGARGYMNRAAVQKAKNFDAEQVRIACGTGEAWKYSGSTLEKSGIMEQIEQGKYKSLQEKAAVFNEFISQTASSPLPKLKRRYNHALTEVLRVTKSGRTDPEALQQVMQLVEMSRIPGNAVNAYLSEDNRGLFDAIKEATGDALSEGTIQQAGAEWANLQADKDPRIVTPEHTKYWQEHVVEDLEKAVKAKFKSDYGFMKDNPELAAEIYDSVKRDCAKNYREKKSGSMEAAMSRSIDEKLKGIEKVGKTFFISDKGGAVKKSMGGFDPTKVVESVLYNPETMSRLMGTVIGEPTYRVSALGDTMIFTPTVGINKNKDFPVKMSVLGDAYRYTGFIQATEGMGYNDLIGANDVDGKVPEAVANARTEIDQIVSDISKLMNSKDFVMGNSYISNLFVRSYMESDYAEVSPAEIEDMDIYDKRRMAVNVMEYHVRNNALGIRYRIDLEKKELLQTKNFESHHTKPHPEYKSGLPAWMKRCANMLTSKEGVY